VARLQHAHIVQIHEIGEHAGLPFFSLEYVDGGSLAGKLDGTPWTAPEAAHIVETLARAIHAAHQRGIVHRDLKPANILLQIADLRLQIENPAVPQSAISDLQSAIPKITDFGLAKRLDVDSGQTQTGVVMGTPSYMAPEQAGGNSKHLGPGADIYSLGAVLYELVAGRPPFKAATTLDTVLQVLSDEPLPPSRLNSKLPRDLETICLKCLQKEPRKRYATALALAEDLRRFQADEPILARPVGRVERAWRWCRRNPAVAGLLAAVALTLVLGAAGASFFAFQANANAERANANANQFLLEKERADLKAAEAQANEQRARDERLNSDRRLYFSDMRLAQRAWEDDLVERVLELLDGQRPARTGGVDLRGFEWHYWWRLCHYERMIAGHMGRINIAALSSNGRRLAAGGSSGMVKVWDAAAGREVLNLTAPFGVRSVTFSPDGKRLAASGYGDVSVKVWDIGAAGPLQPPAPRALKALALGGVVFSPDSQRLAAGDENLVKIWNTVTGQETLSLKGHTNAVSCMAFSLDGKRLAAGSYDRTVKVWVTATGKDISTLRGHTDFVSLAVFSPDGKRLASAGNDKTVKVWDSITGKETRTIKTWAGHLAFSSDGQRLTTVHQDGTMKVWDASTGAETFSFKTGSPCVGLHADGRRLITAGLDGTMKLWDFTGKGTVSLKRHSGEVQSIAFSPDGARLAVAAGGDGAPGEVKVCNAATGQENFTCKGHTGGATSVAFSQDGKHLISGSGDGTVKVWDAATGRETLKLSGYGDGLFGPAVSVAFSPDGKHLAAGSSGDNSNPGEVKVWDATTGKETLNRKLSNNTVARITFNTDGKLLASGNYGRTVKVWSFAALTSAGHYPPEPSLQGETREIRSAAFSRDGKRLLMSSPDGTVTVWDAATGSKILDLALKGNTALVTSVAFSPDGTRLASGTRDGAVKLWDAATGQETLTLKHTGLVRYLAFSPDGRRLAVGGSDGMVKVWDAGTRE